LEKFGAQVDYFSVGEGFTWETKSLSKDLSLAREGWERCQKLLRDNKHDIYLFDELLYVLKYKFLNLNDVCAVLKKRNPLVHVIVTGRDAPKKIIQMADLATEMKEIKHPFQKGIRAKKGMDF
jgi:cob(I)alamin adenosyltransferase